MATIEERARQYATKIVGGEYVGGFKGDMWLNFYGRYIEIATEQQKIDIDKACGLYCKMCHPSTLKLCKEREKNVEGDWHCRGYQNFRKSMEE